MQLFTWNFDESGKICFKVKDQKFQSEVQLDFYKQFTNLKCSWSLMLKTSQGGNKSNEDVELSLNNSNFKNIIALYLIPISGPPDANCFLFFFTQKGRIIVSIFYDVLLVLVAFL